jgi:sulfur relay (sulfurtransferase) DsrF/TusC family protein
MAKKKVLVSFLRSPVGSTYYLEGVRIALGIMSGEEEHEVTVAYLGSGVRCALKGVDRSYSKSLVDLLKKSVVNGRFYVEKESLDLEGITEKELDDGFAVASREELRKMMSGADLTLSF